MGLSFKTDTRGREKFASMRSRMKPLRNQRRRWGGMGMGVGWGWGAALGGEFRILQYRAAAAVVCLKTPRQQNQGSESQNSALCRAYNRLYPLPSHPLSPPPSLLRVILESVCASVRLRPSVCYPVHVPDFVRTISHEPLSRL